ncbi:cadherin-like beta sandwich domain-containing protein, partial [Alkalihalobacillus trypoxylicola]
TMSINGVTADEVDSIPLTVGENVIEIEVTAPAGNQQTYTVSITRAASPEARLSSITLSEGELSPEFDWDIYQYRADVDHEVEEIMVTSAAVYSDSTMSINGVESDGENVSTPLSVGENVIEIEVTAPAGNQQTYTVIVNRAASAEASLSSLTFSEGELSPEFDQDIYQYRASVAYEIDEITVTATTVDPDSTMTVNGVNAGEVGLIPLTVGENVIEIEVTAPAGNEQTYTVIVNRAVKEGSAPRAPVLKVEEIFETSIQFAWTEVEHAEIYQLSRDGEIVYVGEHTTFVDKELIANTEYTYTIVARNTFGSSTEYSLTIFTSEKEQPVENDQKDEEEFEEEQQITEPSKPIKEDNGKEDKKDEENMEDEKNKLPFTASSSYHYLLLGVFTIALGIWLFIIYRRYHAKSNE